MRIQASAGRHKFLDEWCESLKLSVSHEASQPELESEFLLRLRQELVHNNFGYWLLQLREAQGVKGKALKKGMAK